MFFPAIISFCTIPPYSPFVVLVFVHYPSYFTHFLRRLPSKYIFCKFNRNFFHIISFATIFLVYINKTPMYFLYNSVTILSPMQDLLQIYIIINEENRLRRFSTTIFHFSFFIFLHRSLSNPRRRRQAFSRSPASNREN